MSPVDDRVYWETAYSTERAVTAAAEAARAAAPGWRRVPPATRMQLLDGFVEALGRGRADLRQMVAWQIGRPIGQADEFDRLQASYAGYKASWPGEQTRVWPSTDAERRWLRREPFGVILSICAWNYPVAMLAAQILAPLLAGNVVIFKHSPQAARISEMLRQAAAEAGLPDGVFGALDLTHDQSARLLASGVADFVTFIGSAAGGRAVRRAAADHFVGEVFELGGKDAAYVRADADVAFAARELVWGSFGNAGQSCCSVERIYVDDVVASRFVDAFVAEARAARVGDPITSDAPLGPVVSGQAAERIRSEVIAAERAGAREVLEYPARDLPRGSAYIAPAVLTGVTHAMSVMRDETFGPVAAIMGVSSDEEAVGLMNQSTFGLTASVWTADLDRGVALAADIEAGNVFVNRADYVDAHLPWGGVKQSGLGRAGGPAWFESLTEPKGIYARAP